MVFNLPNISAWKEKAKEVLWKEKPRNLRQSRKIAIPWFCTFAGQTVFLLLITFAIVVILVLEEHFSLSHKHDSNNATVSSNVTFGRSVENSSNSTELNDVPKDLNTSSVEIRFKFENPDGKNQENIGQCVTVMILLGMLLFILFSRRHFEFTYHAALRECSSTSTEMSNKLRVRRYEYMKKNPLKEKSGKVGVNEYGLHTALSSVELYNLGKFREVKGTLKDFMFAHWGTHLCGFSLEDSKIFIDAVLWLHDLLKAVEWMHRKNIYHLDLQPETVSLHWFEYGTKWYQTNIFTNDNIRRHRLMRLERRYKKVTEAHVVLGQLNHAIRSQSAEVPSKSVGVTEFYRPPECFTLERVDAAKVDSWGIGVIAFEILTGGMLHITSESRSPPLERCTQVFSEVLNKEFVSSAIDNNFCIIDNFIRMCYFQIKVPSYSLDETEFLPDIQKFLGGLLNPDPAKRLSVEQALKTPLMKRVRNRQLNRHYINLPF